MNQDPNEDRLLDHNYDDIQEYDNPMPRWWLYLFWATILYSVLYLLNVPGIGIGKGRIANYQRDLAAAAAKYGARGGAMIPEATLLGWIADPARVAEGKAVFMINCMPCHRADGGGQIGPNLTDDYWIHGDQPADILKTVTEGVPAKGMPSWGQVMKPDQVGRVAAYVITLHGTHPANPKAPEGTRADSVQSAAGAIPPGATP